MAKAPTSKTSAQPWADNPAKTSSEASQGVADGEGGNGGGDNAESNAVGDDPAADAPRLVTALSDIPSTDDAELGTDNDDDLDVLGTHEQAAMLSENDTAKTAPGSELPSFVRDQISPSGIDISLEADRSEKPSLERSAYPSIGEYVTAQLSKASSEAQEKFSADMESAAIALIDGLRSAQQDSIMAENIIDGTAHYGPRVRTKGVESDAGLTSAERNRRARRAAERVQREAMSSKK